MSDLIQTLKAEHANIGKILGLLSAMGIDTEEGRQKLQAAKTGLLSNLAREDEHLYPVLLKAAEDDPILADALEFFSDDIEGVAGAALAFFEKFETGEHSEDFAEDFSALLHVLSQRIQKEETVIYKMFDQLEG